MERRKFTREFKLEAVRLIKERGVGYAQASQDLGMHQLPRGGSPQSWGLGGVGRRPGGALITGA
jgi:hypothetical protein